MPSKYIKKANQKLFERFQGNHGRPRNVPEPSDSRDILNTSNVEVHTTDNMENSFADGLEMESTMDTSVTFDSTKKLDHTATTKQDNDLHMDDVIPLGPTITSSIDIGQCVTHQLEIGADNSTEETVDTTLDMDFNAPSITHVKDSFSKSVDVRTTNSKLLLDHTLKIGRISDKFNDTSNNEAMDKGRSFKHVIFNVFMNHANIITDSSVTTDTQRENVIEHEELTEHDGKFRELIASEKHLYPKEQLVMEWGNLRKRKPGCGMININTTSYLSAALQALFYIPTFANWLQLDVLHRNMCKGCLICTMGNLLGMTQRGGPPIKPLEMYVRLQQISPTLRIGFEEDAFTFLQLLLQSIADSFVDRFPKNFEELYVTPIHQIFRGYIRIILKCELCSNETTTFQNFLHLRLDTLLGDTIDHLLKYHFDRQYSEEIPYKCESCHDEATQKVSVQSAPVVLCLQLKRFSARGKNIKNIPIPLQLDMQSYMAHDHVALKYRLVSMIIHSGSTANDGNYSTVALCKNGQYFDFNNKHVKWQSLTSELNGHAYVLFYQLQQDITQNLVSESSTSTPQANSSTRLNEDINLDSFLFANGANSGSGTTIRNGGSKNKIGTKFNKPVFVYSGTNYVTVEEHDEERHGPINQLHQVFCIPWVLRSMYLEITNIDLYDQNNYVQMTVSVTRTGNVITAAKRLNQARRCTPEEAEYRRATGRIPSWYIGCPSIIAFREEGNELLVDAAFPLPLWAVTHEIGCNIELLVRQKTGAIHARKGPLANLFLADCEYLLDDAIKATHDGWSECNRRIYNQN